MNHGYRKRSDADELALRVRMLNSTHIGDLIQKARDELGSRWNKLGPLDLSRNPLVRYVRVLATAYAIPPGVTGLSPEMARAMGDSSSQVTVARYQRAGYLPMPTEMARASREAEQYLIACHYVGVLVGWSSRYQRPTFKVVTPDHLDIEADVADGGVPIKWRHKVIRNKREVRDVYDLSDPKTPSFRVYDGEKDVTADLLGGTFEGTAYPWRYADGTPYCPIVVYGQPQNLSRGLELVEASLRVSIGWTSWWAAVRDTCFKGRNVRGLSVAGQDSRTDDSGGGQGGAGLAVGPEDVVRWVDEDPEKPGEHWQWDAPFDAENMGKAIASYESNALSQLGVPIDLTATGGEPLKHEVEARQKAAMLHYDDLRAGDVAVLRAAAALLNLHTQTKYQDAPAYGVDYNEELLTALEGNKDGSGTNATTDATDSTV